MGKYVYIMVIGFVVVIMIGMPLYPTIYSMVSAVDVTSFIPLTKSGMVLLSYAFVFFMFYAVYLLAKNVLNK